MSKCEICEKNIKAGCQVSHSNHKTKRKWKPNIHSTKTMIKGVSKRLNVCTKCLRKVKKS